MVPIEQVKNRREAARMNWQPIDTAPKDQTILVYGPKLGHMVVDRDDEVSEEFPWRTLDGPGYHKDGFTHWMPLPDPPDQSNR